MKIVVSITFDECSNSSLVSFYPITLHWVTPEAAKPMSMLLDVLHVFPSEGVGKRCGEALFRRLRSFGLGSRLLCTTSDGASDAIVAAKELGRLLGETYNSDILPSSHMLRCIVHTFQLGVKVASKVINQSTYKLRNLIYFIRSSKVKRAIFKRFAKTMYEHGERDPPCLDCPTRWNSTLEMYQEALKVKNILLCTMSNNNSINEFTGEMPNGNDWNHITSNE